jgi:hypothetical protein
MPPGDVAKIPISPNSREVLSDCASNQRYFVRWQQRCRNDICTILLHNAISKNINDWNNILSSFLIYSTYNFIKTLYKIIMF